MTVTAAPTTPKALNHIGIVVDDIHRAIEWYGEVMGFRLIMGPRTLKPQAAATAETGNIFDARFKEALQAHLVTGNSIGLELFQFVEPVSVRSHDGLKDYEHPGYFHICFTDPDIEGLAQRIVATGGKMRTPVFEFIPGTDRKLVYCEDPFGNIIELFSHTYEQTFANWPLEGQVT
ncbi:VOC family protein [Roseobacter sp. YSTF-M11]|uniref:VOC family protein n=1 Tax=Roseobacter insulae TaxID=2859783 RepID=A0A9X1FRQ9_9RHOB|nr:VOC family protein [Roseobacter insulae]MBW4706372.1 VOC family protein [Roseobacter insulae]